MQLAIERPIAFFDLETTGTNISTDRIVEISILRIDINQKKTAQTFLLNPTIAIPLLASQIHGIYDKDVVNAPTFLQKAPAIETLLQDCDLAGYNSNSFDIPILVEEFMRCDIDIKLEQRKTVDVMNIFHKMEKRDLHAAYQFYCNKDLHNAHSSKADTNATYEVLLAQIERYQHRKLKDNTPSPIENNIDTLAVFSCHHQFIDAAGRFVYDKQKQAIFNFGKYKGQKIKLIFQKDPSYYGWIMGKDFPLYTKKVLKKLYNQWMEEKMNP